MKHKWYIHEGLKNHKRNNYNKAFISNSTVQRHIKSVHGEIKDYVKIELDIKHDKMEEKFESSSDSEMSEYDFYNSCEEEGNSNSPIDSKNYIPNSKDISNEVKLKSEGTESNLCQNFQKRVMHSSVLESTIEAVIQLASQKEQHQNIPCNYCDSNLVFDNSDYLIQHIVTMHPMQCPICPMNMYLSTNEVKKHFETQHNKTQPYFCQICTLIFMDLTTLQDHMENDLDHQNDEITLIIDDSVKTNEALKSSQKLKTEVDHQGKRSLIRKFYESFKEDNRKAINRSGMEYNSKPKSTKKEECLVKINDFLSDKNYGNYIEKCKLCELDLGSVGIYEVHLNKVHEKPSLEFCEQCNITFKRRMGLILHFRRTHLAPDGTYNKALGCDICDAFLVINGFSSYDDLVSHTETVHGKDVLINIPGNIGSSKCPLVNCDSQFNYRKGMMEHLQVRHGEHLISEMLKCTGEEKDRLCANMRFKCPHCERIFTVKKTLVSHLEKNHKDFSGFKYGSATMNTNIIYTGAYNEQKFADGGTAVKKIKRKKI